MRKIKKEVAASLAIGLGLFSTTVFADVVVNYPDFTSTSGLTEIGAAGTAVTSDGTVLRITPASGGQTGAAYSTSAITLGSNATFSTSFQFRFTNPGGIDPADGIVFILAANTAGIGGAGVGMGYSGVQHSVGIEFDTYNNAGYGLGNNDGNSSNHVSIDTNGSLTNSAITNVYGNGSCGFPSGNPSQANYLANGCMSNGHLWTVTIGYNGSKLSVDLIDPSIGTVFHAIQNYAIDISSILGTNQAFVGFTGGTGAGWENHDIVKWQFANTTELGPGGSVPEPATIALLGLSLAGLGAMRRRRT